MPDTSLTVGRLVSFLSEVPLPLLDLAVRLTEEARAVTGTGVGMVTAKYRVIVNFRENASRFTIV